jgi:hypothetical protein
MREVEPRQPDPSRLFPDEDAEPILTVTFALELPFSLRVPETQFVHSRRGPGWDGWGADEIGHLIELDAKIPDGFEPHLRIALKQTTVTVPAPLTAARIAFCDWPGFDQARDDDGGEAEVQRTTALVSVYSRMMDAPFGGDEEDEEAKGWFSRRFDEALVFLNDYLVILADVHREWHISRISRADLPRMAPYRVEVRPLAGGTKGFSSTLDVHATVRDDLPDEREPEELALAVHLVQAYREGSAPFFEWSQYLQESEHHLGSGRYEQAVIAAATAMEVLLNVFFREIWEAFSLEPERLAGVFSCGFKNQLSDHLAKFLVEPVDLRDEELPPGRWRRDCYLVRNRAVHEGYRPSSAEAMDATLATRSFASWIGASMKDDARTDKIKWILQTRPIMSRS